MPGSTLRIVSDVMGQSYTDASFKLFMNNVSIAEQKIPAIANGRYSVKGLHKRDTLILNASDAASPERNEQEIRYEFIKGTGFSQGYLNYVLLNVTRDIALYGNQTIFRSSSSSGSEFSTFRVEHLPSDAQIWEVTDHYNVRSQEFQLTANTATFSTTTNELKTWAVFNSDISEPHFVSKIANQDLLGMTTPNLVIITHKDFKAEAERLAIHRASYNTWSVSVVTTEQIYNDFSAGRQDVSALRDFAKHLRDKNPSALKAILLFGKGSYDYKDRILASLGDITRIQHHDRAEEVTL